jgi:hypothetical protein
MVAVLKQIVGVDLRKPQRVHCSAHSRSGEKCKNWAVRGSTVCKNHGAMSPGKTPTHNRYSRVLTGDMLDAYEYYKSDPDLLSLRSEIALSCTNIDTFLKNIRARECNKGKSDITITSEDQANLQAHVDGIRKLKESESKRVQQDTVINELITNQNAKIGSVLADILPAYLDEDSSLKVIDSLLKALSEGA